MAAAEALVENTEAELKQDMINYNRQKYLVKSDAVSRRNFDVATAKKAMSEANVLEAKANLAEEKLQLSYTKIYAPFDGRIGISTYSVGNLVELRSDPLAQVVMIDPIRVEFNLTESSIMTELQREYSGEKMPNKSGKNVSLKQIITRLTLSNGTEYSQTGKIDFIDNVINPMTGTILSPRNFPKSKGTTNPRRLCKYSY